MLQESKVSFEYVDFHTKMSLILDAAFGNKKTKRTLMVKMPRFETSCLETGVKTLVTETGQQLPPSRTWQGRTKLLKTRGASAK